MCVQINKGNIAPGHPGFDKINKTIIMEATILISGLKDNIGRLIGNARTLNKFDHCRIDRQPPPSGGINLQIQLNGLNGDSSIATCVVNSSVISSLATWPSGLYQHQEGWLFRRIRISLTQSLEGGHIYRIDGSFHDIDNPPNLTPRNGETYQNRKSNYKKVNI